MHLTLPPQIEDQLTQEDARLGLALGLYIAGKLGFGRAAELAGLSRPAFQQSMAQRRIPMDYSMDDLIEDASALGLKPA
ncbi:MAG: UPF0175 family protein [Verrucomicrobiaceae bacterium]|nr:UPF0175 family protein [Verrucomicrobiaceae bacterium]